jgi:hypothetical protein
MSMQVDAIERKIRQDIIESQFPEMADAAVTHQTYQSAEGTLEGIRGRMTRLADERPSAPRSRRHQFIYQKEFGASESASHRTVIVITDDSGEVQRVFRSR